MASFLCLLLNIALDFILIPIYGIVGVAIAVAASWIMYCILSYCLVNLFYHRIKLPAGTLKILIAILVMGVLIFAINSINPLIVVILAAILYIALLLLLKTFDEIDKKMFFDLLKIIKPKKE
jgi:O-antigen/teichoic acid export membrane protein